MKSTTIQKYKEVMREFPNGATVYELAEVLGISYNGVYKRIEELVEMEIFKFSSYEKAENGNIKIKYTLNE